MTGCDKTRLLAGTVMVYIALLVSPGTASREPLDGKPRERNEYLPTSSILLSQRDIYLQLLVRR
ncbi:hypothetical protein F7725_002168 [Dissostichus mawsoni]|uniref:Uncharacterized protein n=1 Tax=Dissostichus mawsoni TaxID=36200 RepID=A0A7J5Y3H0_DISMA|nr:hypothetical protein F7725_002168 [Dissostichus mawsoni]